MQLEIVTVNGAADGKVPQDAPLPQVLLVAI